MAIIEQLIWWINYIAKLQYQSIFHTKLQRFNAVAGMELH